MNKGYLLMLPCQVGSEHFPGNSNLSVKFCIDFLDVVFSSNNNNGFNFAIVVLFCCHLLSFAGSEIFYVGHLMNSSSSKCWLF